jgi:pimeloyl-ACP methyl ester carboxylesterase
MATTTPTAAAAVSTPNGESRRGPIRKVVAGSLLTGTVLATVLPLLVFDGALEPIITGSAMLGFATGWAMLAVLSTRMTSQPQRWAWVPAGALGATGLALLWAAPEDTVLTAAGWVWPPLLLAIAIWIGIRMRRSLAAGSGRWLLYPVVALIGAAALGGGFETVALASDHAEYPAPGRLYDVGGYRLHIDCTGSGSPTVVLTNGLGWISASWARIAPAVADTTRVCVHDRAGQAWSDDAPDPQDGLAAAADLHTLLSRAGEVGPYVLVGHSIGGDYAMTYAARYPDQVAGMVLVDTTPPYGVGTPSGHAGPPSSVAVLPSLARLGIGWLLPTSWTALPEPAAGQFKAFASSPRGFRSIAAESNTLPALLTQAQSLSTLGSKPLVVLTAAEHVTDPNWAAAHNRMTALSTNSSHRATDATHGSLLDEEHGANLTARAIDDVVRADRTGTNLPPN